MPVVSNEPKTGVELPVSLQRMPPFPQVALQALKALAAEDVPATRVEGILATDAVFASSALHCANSALFGLSSRVLTLRHAIVVMGMERLRGLILTTALKSFVSAPLRSPGFRDWWHHSLATALLADAIAKTSGQHLPEVYAAGLLHDIGRLALILQISREDWKAFLYDVKDPEKAGESILGFERSRFGIDHCELGEKLLHEWGLPAELARCARQHHSAGDGLENGALPYVAVACEICSRLGFAALEYPRRRTIESLVPCLPENARALTATDPAKLREALATKIHSLDS